MDKSKINNSKSFIEYDSNLLDQTENELLITK